MISFKKYNKLTRYSWATSAVILIIGFLFLHFKMVDYSTTFFVIFPFAVGFSIGTLDKKERKVSYLIFGLLIFFGFLLAGALEGLICVLMALPIFALMVFSGYKVQERFVKKEVKESRKILVTLSPILLLLTLNPLEQMIIPEPSIITIENSIVLDYDPELVFDEVKQMDKLDAKKPIGLMLGLPSPYQCVLEADTIGAKRNCLFRSGRIVAEITKFDKGNILEMDVVEYTLTGREWFKFIDAKYTFQKLGGKTRITRTSSYTSILHPRFYWQPLESWGIGQEHQFVLNSLKKNLSEKYGR